MTSDWNYHSAFLDLFRCFQYQEDAYLKVIESYWDSKEAISILGVFTGLSNLRADKVLKSCFIDHNLFSFWNLLSSQIKLLVLCWGSSYFIVNFYLAFIEEKGSFVSHYSELVVLSDNYSIIKALEVYLDTFENSTENFSQKPTHISQQNLKILPFINLKFK